MGLRDRTGQRLTTARRPGRDESPPRDVAGTLRLLRGIPDCLVREGGVEPPRPFGHTDLNRARLPIPPLAPEADVRLSHAVSALPNRRAGGHWSDRYHRQNARLGTADDPEKEAS